MGIDRCLPLFPIPDFTRPKPAGPVGNRKSPRVPLEPGTSTLSPDFRQLRQICSQSIPCHVTRNHDCTIRHSKHFTILDQHCPCHDTRYPIINWSSCIVGESESRRLATRPAIVDDRSAGLTLPPLLESGSQVFRELREYCRTRTTDVISLQAAPVCCPPVDLVRIAMPNLQFVERRPTTAPPSIYPESTT